MSSSTQQEDYTCGPAAVRYLLERFNVRISERALAAELRTTARRGTTHKAIRDFLDRRKLRYVEKYNSTWSGLILPALVNFQCEGDGHYGVAESMIEGGLVVWDPWTGGNRWYSEGEWLGIWFSSLYGRRWFLHICLHQDA
jgi:predicted double-glycine peptidase